MDKPFVISCSKCFRQFFLDYDECLKTKYTRCRQCCYEYLQQDSEEYCEFKKCTYYCDPDLAKFRWEVDQIIDEINLYNNITKKILEALKNLSNKHPKSIYLLNQIGIAYYKIFSSPKESIPYFKRALLVDHEHNVANFCLGSVYAELGEDEKAFSFFKKTWGNQLDNTECIGGGFGYHYFPFQYLDPTLDEYLKAEPFLSDRGDLYATIANVFLNKGEDDLYCKYLEKGVKANPKAVYLLQFVFDHYFYNGNYKKAIELGEQLINIYKEVKDEHQGEINWGSFFVCIGDSYKNIGEYEKAFNSYKKVIEEYKDKYFYVDAYKHIGDLHYKLREYDDALKAYKKGIKCSVESFKTDVVDCYRSMGWIFFERKKYRDAIDAFVKALNIKTDPNIAKEIQMTINKTKDISPKRIQTQKKVFEVHKDAKSAFSDLEPDKILDLLERKLRKHIENNLKIISNDWWEENVPDGVKEDSVKAKEKEKKKYDKHPYLEGSKSKLIDYTYLGGLKDIIVYKTNWNKVYNKIFRERKILENYFEILVMLRNQHYHTRRLDENQKDYLRVYAKTIIDLLAVSEKE